MNTNEKDTTLPENGGDSLAIRKRDIIEKLRVFSGREIMDSIFEDLDPHELVSNIPPQDLFWLVKKIGEDESPAVLSLASEDQWQYMLDIELWKKERLDDTGISSWFKILHLADSKRLARWLFNEGQWISFYYFYKKLHVLVWDEDSDSDIPEGYTSYDGVFYFKVLSEEDEGMIKDILKDLSMEGLERYQSLLMGIGGVLPAELEEEIYRQRNVRLAEHGFLPREEALLAYSPLRPEALSKIPDGENVLLLQEENLGSIPVAPIINSGDGNYLANIIARSVDPELRDRLIFEFAGLCNQILSVDGLLDVNIESLIETCRKTAGYLNIAMEKLCGRDFIYAENLLRGNSLLSLFRVGFGMSMELKWETERWLKKCWFLKLGLDFMFWGEEKGGTLSAIMQKRPQRYSRSDWPEGYGHFETLSELEETNLILLDVRALDGLLEKISVMCGADDISGGAQDITFETLFLTFWARKVVGLEPTFEGLRFEEIKQLFDLLRDKDKGPPYRMKGFGRRFVADFSSFVSQQAPEFQKISPNALARIWKSFQEEYSWVPCNRMDARFIRFFRLMPD